MFVYHVYSIFEQMDKVQSIDEVQSVPEAEKQKKEAKTQEKGLEMQQKDPGKRKRETQAIGYAIKGYWKEKNIRVNGVEKEITVVKDLVFSCDEPLLEDQSITKETWGFVKK